MALPTPLATLTAGPRPPVAPPSASSDGVPSDAERASRLAAWQTSLLSKRGIWSVPRHRISLKRSKYMVVRVATSEMKWRSVAEDKDASIVWMDRWENADLSNLAPPRKIGHFPGMSALGSKCSIGRALNRIRHEFPGDYDFHPVSFTLPHERAALRDFDAAFRAGTRAARRANVIGAPVGGSGGRGGAPAAPPAGDVSLLAPSAGCWPLPGVQSQPLPGRDRIVYIVKPDGGARGQGIYLALCVHRGLAYRSLGPAPA